MKIRVDDFLSNGVARTLLIPLWCCATSCAANPAASYDPRAADVLNKLDFDFAEIQRSFKEYGQVCCLAREMNVDTVVASFLDRHPEGTIVNLGCGFSTAAYRTPLGKAQWYDLDQPEVIRIREALLPPGKGHTLLPGDIFDPHWLQCIDFQEKRGVLLLAAGVFHYQQPWQMQALLPLLADSFPGGMLFFDASSRMGMKVSNRYVKRSGNHTALMSFSVDTPHRLARLSRNIVSVEETPFFHGFSVKGLALTTRMNMAVVRCFSMLKYVTLHFKNHHVDHATCPR